MEATNPSAELTYEAALAAVTAAIEKGIDIGCNMNASVVDKGGNQLAFIRVPGAFLQSASIAEDKAYTSAGFGLPTINIFAIMKTSEALKAGLGERPRIVIFGGGLPIVIGGQLVGGIGVSGGSEEQDTICAHAGLSAIGGDPVVG